MKFCNYDDVDTGFCEECKDYSTYQDCTETGLPEAGANDCALNCFGIDNRINYFEDEVCLET